MKYEKFTISNYRAIKNDITIDISKETLVPLVGLNECGKTTILQGIFCFDYFNDKEYAGKHLQNTRNLYDTIDKDAIVSAHILITDKEITECYNTLNDQLKKASIKDAQGNPIKEMTDDILANIKGKKHIEIRRNISKNNYHIVDFSGIISDDLQNPLAKEIIKNLPYTIYNDDFNDRPQSLIPIEKDKNGNISGWLAIYERLFASAKEEYSLFDLIDETDSRRRNAIISDVEDLLNDSFTKAWRTFSGEKKENIKIHLSLEKDEKYNLKIEIIEKKGSKERFFEISDRSKGFLWYYNFIMKIQFNNKVTDNPNDTIYLLDEPGSYLHADAQEKLCGKIREISDKFGVVIYCTHSHHLLNPELIPPNIIKIVEKDAEKKIMLFSLPIFKTKTEKLSALQPLFEALSLPEYEFFHDDSCFLLVEGMYDKYVISLFCHFDRAIRIFPGSSADSIYKNIQFMLNYDKNYIALWDNDDEGSKKMEKAKKHYSDYEANKFLLLPLNGKSKRRMENMFQDSDLEKLRSFVGLPKEATYESTILQLYYKKSHEKEALIRNLSEESRSLFNILSSSINEIISREYE